jgi:putative transcriptional regulator
MTTKRRRPLFARLKQGLEEGIVHVRGELTLRTVEVPEEPPEIDGKTLAALRTQAAMSQAVFAKLLNVSTKTLQSWEQGLRQPSDASRRLIQVFREEPGMVCRIVGLPEIALKQDHGKETTNRRRKVVFRPALAKK